VIASATKNDLMYAFNITSVPKGIDGSIDWWRRVILANPQAIATLSMTIPAVVPSCLAGKQERHIQQIHPCRDCTEAKQMRY
jgi:hypothetical protein